MLHVVCEFNETVEPTRPSYALPASLKIEQQLGVVSAAGRREGHRARTLHGWRPRLVLGVARYGSGCRQIWQTTCRNCAAYCCAHAHWQRAEEALQRSGELMIKTAEGYPRVNSLARIATQAMEDMRR